MSPEMTSKMKKITPHEQKDYLGKRHKTTVRMVEDMVTDPTEPHMKTVKTQEAEVRNLLGRQSREFCSFAIPGGKLGVRRGKIYIVLKKGEIYIVVKKGEIYINMMKGEVYSVVMQYVAVKSAVVEDMSGVPLSLTSDSVTGDSSDYSNREEVLAEPGMRLVVFPPAQKQKEYEVAKQKGVEKYIMRIKLRDKEVKLGRRSEESCKMQRTRIFQILS
jgi:hypothetical protein